MDKVHYYFFVKDFFNAHNYGPLTFSPLHYSSSEEGGDP